MQHDLKIWPEHYADVRTGVKRFELRKDDRDFQVGDKLLLREWCPGAKTYTGRVLTVGVYYVMRGGEHGLHPEYCAMSIALESEDIR